MIIIFDLDDTLYDELSFVYSGFRAVSKHLNKTLLVNETDVYLFMVNELRENGRGKVFDKTIVNFFGKSNKRLVRELLSVYRKHKPDIFISEEVESILSKLSKEYKLYLVTDGNLNTQRNKIKSLNLSKYFVKCIPTRNFGLDAEKPSMKVFEYIRKKENCSSKIMYIGDNPRKDFFAVNSMGGITCLLRTGCYSSENIRKTLYKPAHKFDNISDWFHWFTKEKFIK
jgi:putative hydrolase of the HAD superfamily